MHLYSGSNERHAVRPGATHTRASANLRPDLRHPGQPVLVTERLPLKCAMGRFPFTSH